MFHFYTFHYIFQKDEDLLKKSFDATITSKKSFDTIITSRILIIIC